jgi:hypothetical protein
MLTFDNPTDPARVLANSCEQNKELARASIEAIDRGNAQLIADTCADGGHLDTLGNTLMRAA